MEARGAVESAAEGPVDLAFERSELAADERPDVRLRHVDLGHVAGGEEARRFRLLGHQPLHPLQIAALQVAAIDVDGAAAAELAPDRGAQLAEHLADGVGGGAVSRLILDQALHAARVEHSIEDTDLKSSHALDRAHVLDAA